APEPPSTGTCRAPVPCEDTPKILRHGRAYTTVTGRAHPTNETETVTIHSASTCPLSASSSTLGLDPSGCDKFLGVWVPEYRDHQTHTVLHSASSCKTRGAGDILGYPRGFSTDM
ncbi:unnamed protein product, partial [Laminaria digitata]